jgi:hypothetical protein
MTHFLLKLIIFPLLVFTLSNIAARALGTTQPTNPALAGFTEGCQGKPQPCWYGIVPGVTTTEETQEILSQLGYKETPTQVFSFGYELSEDAKIFFIVADSAMTRMTLTLDNIYVGDVISVLGKPDYIVLNSKYDPANGLYRKRLM